MAYFNYHAKAKRKIIEGKLVGYNIIEKWNSISPALVLFFIDSPPMPIRESHWSEYIILIENYYHHNIKK